MFKPRSKSSLDCLIYDEFTWKQHAALHSCRRGYMGTLLIRNSAPLGLYSMTMPRTLWWSEGVGVFL